MSELVNNVIKKVCHSTFGKPLVTNVLRGHVVEAIVSMALEPEWKWCSADYASWDFERADRMRLEVKQSAYKQSWESKPGMKISPSFDIKAHTGRWEEGEFVLGKGRASAIYVFAYHGINDDKADHRDPNQWEFYVVATEKLHNAMRLSLKQARKLADPVLFVDLLGTVTKVAATVKWIC